MIHKVTSDWLQKVELKLRLTPLKTDRINKRTEEILSALERVCQKADSITIDDTPIKKEINLYEKFKEKLSVIISKCQITLNSI